MPALRCDIVTPEERLFSGEVYLATVPGVEGEMGFLANHEPLVSALADGIARIQLEKDGEMQRFAIQGGYVEVTGGKAIILADRARRGTEVDVEAIREELAATEVKLAALSPEEAQKTMLPLDVSWYKALLSAAEAS